MKYGVFHNDSVPCSEASYPYLKGLGWITHLFDTEAEAKQYAMKWLGFYAPKTLTLNQPFSYNDIDTIVVKEVK